MRIFKIIFKKSKAMMCGIHIRICNHLDIQVLLFFLNCYDCGLLTIICPPSPLPPPPKDSNINVILNVKDLFENYNVQHVNSSILLKKGSIINTKISRDFKSFLNRIYLTMWCGYNVNYDIKLILFCLALFR